MCFSPFEGDGQFRLMCFFDLCGSEKEVGDFCWCVFLTFSVLKKEVGDFRWCVCLDFWGEWTVSVDVLFHFLPRCEGSGGFLLMCISDFCWPEKEVGVFCWCLVFDFVKESSPFLLLLHPDFVPSKNGSWWFMLVCYPCLLFTAWTNLFPHPLLQLLLGLVLSNYHY